MVTILLFLMVPAHKIYKKYLMVRKANVANVSSQQRGTCNFTATVDKWWHSVALKVGCDICVNINVFSEKVKHNR